MPAQPPLQLASRVVWSSGSRGIPCRLWRPRVRRGRPRPGRGGSTPRARGDVRRRLRPAPGSWGRVSTPPTGARHSSRRRPPRTSRGPATAEREGDQGQDGVEPRRGGGGVGRELRHVSGDRHEVGRQVLLAHDFTRAVRPRPLSRSRARAGDVPGSGDPTISRARPGSRTRQQYASADVVLRPRWSPVGVANVQAAGSRRVLLRAVRRRRSGSDVPTRLRACRPPTTSPPLAGHSSRPLQRGFELPTCQAASQRAVVGARYPATA